MSRSQHTPGEEQEPEERWSKRDLKDLKANLSWSDINLSRREI